MNARLLSLGTAVLLGLGSLGTTAVSHPHENGERQTLALSAKGVSDPKAPETFTFQSSVTSKCYADIGEALTAHADLSNHLQEYLQALRVGEVKSSGIAISEYQESSRTGEVLCDNTKRVTQVISLVAKKNDRETIVGVYGALAKATKAKGIRGKLGEKSVSASLGTPAPGLSEATYKSLRTQAVARATQSLEEQKNDVLAACPLENLSKAPTMSWSISEPLVPRTESFGGARAAAFDGGGVAEVNPEGITVTAHVTATYHHDGGVCRVPKK